MTYRDSQQKSEFLPLLIATLLVVFIFALIGFVAFSVLTGNLDSGGVVNQSQPGPDNVVEVEPLGTPNPLGTIAFKSSSLGFSLEYPKAWRKREQGLQVIFSPSGDGLDPANLQDAALWIGIPTDNSTNPEQLLTHLQLSLWPNSQTLESGSRAIGGERWQTAKISFDDARLGGPTIAFIAAVNQNEVGYYLVAIAPANEWPVLEAQTQNIFNSFQFTTEAVLRPTDATPPPTPTPTPTPVFYIVQSGDTLSKIALQYGVTIEALATRNDIDDPRSLRTGVKLIIPIKRR